MEKKPNIYWIIIDSVRTYKTGLDDRDRIDILDEVAKDSTEFLNCVTGAPSSLLSAGAMFTGLPSTFVARHFNEWKFTGMEISTISSLKKDYNYETYPILDSRGLREKLHKLLPPLKHKELPKGYNLSDYVWHNKDVTKIFKHYLEKEDPNKNHAYILWYDCRRDDKTSDHVKEAIDAIKEKGDFENSIIIMNSDHGYPDPRTKLNEEYFKDIGHDMIFTDDNIKVPLIIKTPNGPKGVKFKHQVGLVDVLPTIFDALGLRYKKLNTTFQGKSLIPIINGEEPDERIRKVDTRLPMDVKRIGCLRNNSFKYVYLYNDELEFFYNLKEDPDELNNLIGKTEFNKELDEFRKLNIKYEEELFLFHEKQVKENLDKSLDSFNHKKLPSQPKIVVVTKGIEVLINIFINAILKKFDKPEIILILTDGKEINNENIYKTHYVNEFSKNSFISLDLKNVDIAVFLTENASRVFLKKTEIDSIREIRAKQTKLINFNFEVFDYFKTKWLNINHIKLFFDWETKGYFYKEEPSYLIKDTGIFVKGLFTKVYNILFKNRQEIDINAAREAVYFRQAIVEINKNEEYDSVGIEEFDNEIDRLHTRD